MLCVWDFLKHRVETGSPAFYRNIFPKYATIIPLDWQWCKCSPETGSNYLCCFICQFYKHTEADMNATFFKEIHVPQGNYWTFPHCFSLSLCFTLPFSKGLLIWYSWPETTFPFPGWLDASGLLTTESRGWNSRLSVVSSSTIKSLVSCCSPRVEMSARIISNKILFFWTFVKDATSSGKCAQSTCRVMTG